MRIHLALNAQGIVCLPDFTVRRELAEGSLRIVMEERTRGNGTLWVAGEPACFSQAAGLHRPSGAAPVPLKGGASTRTAPLFAITK